MINTEIFDILIEIYTAKEAIANQAKRTESSLAWDDVKHTLQQAKNGDIEYLKSICDEMQAKVW